MIPSSVKMIGLRQYLTSSSLYFKRNTIPSLFSLNIFWYFPYLIGETCRETTLVPHSPLFYYQNSCTGKEPTWINLSFRSKRYNHANRNDARDGETINTYPKNSKRTIFQQTHFSIQHFFLPINNRQR